MSAPSSCLSDEQLRALLQGAPEAPLPEWMAHLDVCVRCCDRLDALGGGSERLHVMHRPTPAASISPPLRDAMQRLKGSEGTSRIGAEETTPLLGTKVRYLGDYEIIEELGRGGMGVVFRARQLSLRREVAIKVILAGQLASPADVRRFRVEAEAAAKLDHPNIVPIFEIGEHEGHHFFSMKLVEGGSFSERITHATDQRSSDDKFDIRNSALVIAQIARAVHYAHQRGVLHRDLKPSNILIDREGQPHLTDFGLAKMLEHDSGLTYSAAIMGTPNYLAPEMAAGKAKEVTTAVDVFSLGAILYELLTGRPLFKEENVAATLQKVIHAEPTLPRVLNPALPRDLEIICLKCLEKEPLGRYTSARALAEDLERWLRHEPILARRSGVWEQAAKWARRHPARAGLLSLALVAPAIIISVLLVTTAKVRYERNVALQRERWAVRAQGEAKTERQRAEAALQRMELQRAEDFFGQDDAPTALAYLARVLRQEPTNEVVAARILSALSFRSFALPVLKPLQHDQSVKSARFSPDGQMIATASDDKTARVWETRTGRLLSTLRHDDAVSAAEFSPDGQSVATASWDHTARIWDARSGEPLTSPLPHREAVLAASFSPDGQWLISVSRDDTACLWSTRTGERRFAPILAGKQVRCARFSPDGLRVVIGGGDYSAQVWDARNGQSLLPMPMQHKHIILGAEFSPDGQWIGTASEDQTARLWDANNGEALTPFLQHGGLVKRLEFSPDGGRVLTASKDRTAQVWDARTGRSLVPPLQHNGEVYSAGFSVDGLRIITASRDKTARVWEAHSGRALVEPFSHGRALTSSQFSPDGLRAVTTSSDHRAQLWDVRLARSFPLSLRTAGRVLWAEFSPDGQLVVAASSDGTARIWNVRTGRLLVTLRPRDWVRSAQFDPDGQRLLTTAITEKSVRLWEARTGRQLTNLVHQRLVFCAQWSPDGRRVVTGSADFKAHLWDAESGKEIYIFPHKDEVRFAAFSPQGEKVATASQDRTAQIWDVRTGKPIGAALQHSAAVRTIQFSPDGRFVVTASADNTAQIWDSDTGEKLVGPFHHQHEVVWAEFSPDGQQVVTASDDNTARVWDAATGQPVTRPLPHNGQVLSAHFNPAGNRVITASDDGTARIWDARSGQPTSEQLRHAGKVNTARFSPDGRWIVTAGDDQAARVWEVPEMPLPVPAWLPELAEAIAGSQRNPQGLIEHVPTEALLALKEKLDSSGETDAYTRWVKWFFADRDTRRISLSASIRVPEYIERLIEENTAASLEEVLHVSPTNSSAFVRLARHALTQDALSNPRATAEADLYSRVALQFAPGSEEAWWGRMEVLAGVGNTSALKNVEKELERRPATPELWELKARLLEKADRFDEAYQVHSKALGLVGADSARAPLRSQILLGRAHTLRCMNRLSEAAADNLQARGISPRDPQTSSNLIDLSPYYNAALHEPWSRAGGSANNLSTLPSGVQQLATVPFDIRGIISLSGAERRKYAPWYPQRVSDIRISRTCRRLIFLHGTTWAEKDGIRVGTYRIHYADGEQREIPIIYGRSLRDWWASNDDKDLTKPADDSRHAQIAWRGRTPSGQDIRLFSEHWENPRVDVQIKSIDFVSTMTPCAPFLIALTAE